MAIGLFESCEEKRAAMRPLRLGARWMRPSLGYDHLNPARPRPMPMGVGQFPVCSAIRAVMLRTGPMEGAIISNLSSGCQG